MKDSSKQAPERAGVEFRRDPRAFVDRKVVATRTALVHPQIRDQLAQMGAATRQREFAALARAIRLDVRFEKVLPVRAARPATFFGTGQIEALAARILDGQIELVLVDASLSPIQQRNLERQLDVKILDRTALILEIFGDRAATREGVLQVELAHLNYQRSRLVRSWTHLERQRGGVGFLGGPGETQIEADRRQLRDRVSALEKRIEKIRQTRAMQRKPRSDVPFPLVALVGYTNAGKSTLFNRLTGAGVMARNILFATLDTTVRKVSLPHGKQVILSDTVGFIADLPADLIAAFRATLEEVTLADVILHVRDASNPDHPAQAQEVLAVLKGLKVNPERTPIIEVWNKSDLVTGEQKAARADKSSFDQVLVSAQTGQGMDALLACIERALARDSRTFRVLVPHAQGEKPGWLYRHCEVLARGAPQQDAQEFRVRVLPRHMDGFRQRFGRLIVQEAAE